jgi:UDP-glucose 4-epimerase
MKQIKTLVIGGAGFIGSHTLPLLIEAGRSVTVVGRSKEPTFTKAHNLDYKSGDFGDFSFISRLLDTHEEIIHLAYATVPNTSFENPLADLQQNLIPAVQLFAEAAKRDRKVLLVSSGGTVYGEAKEHPIVESSPKNPISPYGLTKLTLESYAYLYGVTHGLNFVVVRPANAYGPGQKPFTGQGFISTAIASAKEGKAIKIFGKAGTVRDYIEVSDLAAGLVSALIYGKPSEVYNIGTGMGLSNLDVIEKLRLVLSQYGVDILTEHLPERLFDVKVNVLDSSKLTHDSGWASKLSFDSGILRTVKWHFNDDK